MAGSRERVTALPGDVRIHPATGVAVIGVEFTWGDLFILREAIGRMRKINCQHQTLADLSARVDEAYDKINAAT